jgi:hypothetical protein
MRNVLCFLNQVDLENFKTNYKIENEIKFFESTTTIILNKDVDLKFKLKVKSQK